VIKRGLLLGALLIAAGCGRGDACDRVSPCKNDPPQSKESKDACKAAEKAAMSAPCFNEAVTYAGCFNDNVACGTDGKTDAIETKSRTMAICSGERQKLESCCGANAGSAACQ
jgi:hypothetical protein